jgi:ATP-dependent RNA helicase RhlE
VSSFATLGLIEPLTRALAEEGYTQPTPIQQQAIPPILAGRDMLGCAQTGTGKTAAFALPLMQRLSATQPHRTPRGTRVLVMVPTRELAVQVSDAFGAYGRHLPLSRTTVFGGVGQQGQVRALSRGVDVLVATPGRLLDLINQRHLVLSGVEALVLDEADRMLDMGFIRDIRKVLALVPARRQTLLFSATMPESITSLAGGILRDPARVAVTPIASTVDQVSQHVMFVDRADKRSLLGDVLRDPSMTRAIVFTRTKHGADRLADQLRRNHRVGAEAIHGNKSQGARQKALEDFRAGRARVLVATDIAARGIDVDGITHVINFELPNDPESYVHRIGRTARAGATGVALSFCDSSERDQLRDIERLTKRRLNVVTDHPYAPAGGGAPARAGR